VYILGHAVEGEVNFPYDMFGEIIVSTRKRGFARIDVSPIPMVSASSLLI
jgi:hypothetical protein